LAFSEFARFLAKSWGRRLNAAKYLQALSKTHLTPYYQSLYSDFTLLGLGIISFKISIPDIKTN